MIEQHSFVLKTASAFVLSMYNLVKRLGSDLVMNKLWTVVKSTVHSLYIWSLIIHNLVLFCFSYYFSSLFVEIVWIFLSPYI